MWINRTAALLSVGVATLGSALAFANSLGGDAGAAPPAPASVTETIRVEVPWQGGTFAQIDLGRQGLGPGDMFVGSNLPIRDPVTGKRIGSTDGWEIILSGRHNGTVAGQSVLRFANGSVIVDGLVHHTDKPNVFAVTGGTGSYSGVGGTMTLLREDSKRKVEIMRLDLVH